MSRDKRLQDRTIYPHWCTDTVRFCDQDAAGHVNNVALRPPLFPRDFARLRASPLVAAFTVGGDQVIPLSRDTIPDGP